MALTWRGRLQPGERVLVLGGGGAVGQAAIGAARALGAAAGRRRVPRSDGRSGGPARPGRTSVVPLVDGRRRSSTARLAEATGGAVDVVLDPVFGTAATAAVPGPRRRAAGWSTSAARRATTAPFSSAVLRSRSASVLGYTNNALTAAQRRDALTAVLRHASSRPDHHGL